MVRASERTRGLEQARAALDDPAMVALAVCALTLFAFAAVRLGGGAPSPLLELGYAPVLLAAVAYRSRGGLVTGLAVGAALGPLPAALGLDHVENVAAWAVRTAAFAGVGGVVGLLLRGSASATVDAEGHVRAVLERERSGLLALARAAESRDTDAGEHVRRLELTSARLAKAIGLSDLEAAEVGWAAMLHDLGKLRVPERILLNPAPLNPDEWAIVRLHPIWGEQAVGPGEGLAMARQVARSHHENWDGTGYPDGLYGDRIPLAARIVRITDAFDAMTNKRPYAQAQAFEAAFEELFANAGHDYDPDLAHRFVELVRTDAELRSTLLELRTV